MLADRIDDADVFICQANYLFHQLYLLKSVICFITKAGDIPGLRKLHNYPNFHHGAASYGNEVKNGLS